MKSDVITLFHLFSCNNCVYFINFLFFLIIKTKENFSRNTRVPINRLHLLLKGTQEEEEENPSITHVSYHPVTRTDE